MQRQGPHGTELDAQRGTAPGRLLSGWGVGEGGGVVTQTFEYQKWDQIFPIVNFVFSRDGPFGLGGGGPGEGGLAEPPPPPLWRLIVRKTPWTARTWAGLPPPEQSHTASLQIRSGHRLCLGLGRRWAPERQHPPPAGSL